MMKLEISQSILCTIPRGE